MNDFFSNRYLLILLSGGLLSVLSCLFYSPDGSTPQSMLVSAIYVLMSVNMSIENQLYLVALGVPNTKALGFGGISSSIVVCTVAVFSHLIKDKKKPSVPFIAFVLFFYSLQYILRDEDYLAGAVMPIKTMANILFFVLLCSNSKVAADSFNIGLKASIALFVGIVSAFAASTFESLDARRMTIAGNDPNMISIEIAFVFSYLSVAYFTSKNFFKWFYYGAAIVLGILTMMCGSRMGMILYAFVLLSSIFLNAKNFGKSFVLATVLGLGTVIFLLSKAGQSAIEAITLRMEVLENADNISNGRFEIWAKYFYVLNSNDYYWLFGLGSYKNYGLEDMAHNFLIEDIALYGIIGVLILYSTYIGIYRKQYRHSLCLKRNKTTFYNSIPFLVPLIGSLTLHGLGSIMITTMLYLGVLCMTGDQKIPKNKIQSIYEDTANKSKL